MKSIIDCLEIELEEDCSLDIQAQTWSEYKKADTLKYLLFATPHALVYFMSPGFGRRILDTKIIESSKIVESIPRPCAILANRDFKSIAGLLTQHNWD